MDVVKENTSKIDAESKKPMRLPQWLKQNKTKAKATKKLSQWLEKEVPNSICQEARCPNRGECFSKGVLTFMILGTVCTRNCAFCSVRHGRPMPPDLSELQKILHAITKLNLRFVVLTSPNRDDLPDGGAWHYATIVSSIHKDHPSVKVEVLIPDFQGKTDDLDIVIGGRPDVINHNIETVPSLYRDIRKGSLYGRSLDVLSYIKEKSPKTLTKTGIMLGLGETHDELLQTFRDVADRGVDILTLGQYLKPTKDQADVKKYYTPEEFDKYKTLAEEAGIKYVFSGPLVRSSYLAEHVFDDVASLAS
ncbi:MAG: lipoyl synthase [Candidatus Marinamargulisbacteria bacterium]